MSTPALYGRAREVGALDDLIDDIRLRGGAVVVRGEAGYENDDRAPLLFISGSEDHLMPLEVQRSNAKHDKSDTITEVKEFEGPHLLPSCPDWEEVADYGLTWASSMRVAAASGTLIRITHIGGPTVLSEVGGWRLLTDPTFDPPTACAKWPTACK